MLTVSYEGKMAGTLLFCQIGFYHSFAELHFNFQGYVDVDVDVDAGAGAPTIARSLTGKAPGKHELKVNTFCVRNYRIKGLRTQLTSPQT